MNYIYGEVDNTFPPSVFKRENHLDQLVLAGKDGISVIWFDTSTNNWKSENIGVGLPPTPGNEFWGSGSGEI